MVTMFSSSAQRPDRTSFSSSDGAPSSSGKAAGFRSWQERRRLGTYRGKDNLKYHMKVIRPATVQHKDDTTHTVPYRHHHDQASLEYIYIVIIITDNITIANRQQNHRLGRPEQREPIKRAVQSSRMIVTTIVLGIVVVVTRLIDRHSTNSM